MNLDFIILWKMKISIKWEIQNRCNFEFFLLWISLFCKIKELEFQNYFFLVIIYLIFLYIYIPCWNQTQNSEMVRPENIKKKPRFLLLTIPPKISLKYNFFPEKILKLQKNTTTYNKLLKFSIVMIKLSTNIIL